MAQPMKPVEDSHQDLSGKQLNITNGRRHALSGWPMIVAWIGMMVFALHACTHMVGAGDTWVAMACGRHFINHGVDTVEPFSANSHKAGPTVEEIETWPGPAKWIAKKVGIDTVRYWHPTGWVNQNWLTHVMFYWLTHESPFADAEERSFNSLVYGKFAVYILTIICVYYIGRTLRVNPLLAAAFACFALFAGRSLFDVRPAGFSNLMVAVFFLILVLGTYRNILYLWLIVPTVAFWCNLHGGYIYAFIMLVPFFILHLLILLPKRWTVSLHCILGWTLLYAMTWKFLNHKPFEPIPPMDDRIFHLMVLMIIASIILACAKKIKAEAFYAYHIILSPIIFLMLLPRFFPPNMVRASRDLKEYVLHSQKSFVAAFFVLIGMGLIVTLLKKKLVCLDRRGIYHTAGVGFASLVASIVLNPFHLTNLTHTFVISLSPHAERWRTVNEWHPGFEWNNPVGTGFPFLVLCMMFVGLTVLWLNSRFFKPRNLKAPKAELELNRKRFLIHSKIFSCAIAIFIGWTAFISFSFLNLDIGSFFICGLFIGIILLSVFKNVHFIYLQIPLILLGMWAADGKAGHIGRYIYPFVLLPIYVITHTLVSLLSKKVKTKSGDIMFPAATAVVALLLMVAIFNPLRFGLMFSTNLGHKSRVEMTAMELNRGAMPDQLSNVFKSNKEPLSKSAVVAVDKRSRRWQITNQNPQNNANSSAKKYVVYNKLNRLWMYEPGSPVWKMNRLLRARRPWKAIYEGEKKLDYANLFPVLLILNITLAAIWLVMPYLREVCTVSSEEVAQDSPTDSYELPRIDLVLIVMAALTVYMAYRSRRFIPIAAITACPVLAMFIDQMVRSISSARNYYCLSRVQGAQNVKHNHFNPSAMPLSFERFFSIVSLVIVLSLGTWWSLKFKQVYLDVWPTDPKLTSVFMRMTASDAKPFYALDFIRENKLKGNMFNYWTEGGFIGWGQDPDPETGRTPLLLFMDGRAQAAYDRNAYDNWANIMAGGPIYDQLRRQARGRKLNAGEYAKIGKWIGDEVIKDGVWAILIDIS